MAAPQSVHDAPHVDQYRTGRESCPGPLGGCRVSFGGYLRVGRLEGLDCDSPMLIVHSCGATGVSKCGSHRESRCVPCSWRYRRLLQRVADDGCPKGGYLYMLTLTAPGAVPHWMPSGDRCPCTGDDGTDLAEWNAGMSAAWNRMRTKVKRDCPELQFLKAVEVQKRGALHLHVIVWSPVPLELPPLRRLAMHYGFGHSVDLAFIVPGSRKHAYYVAKYVTKACDSRSSVPWAVDDVDQETGEITRVQAPGRYRTWSASRGWGLTMRQVKDAIRAQQTRRLAALAALEPAAVGETPCGPVPVPASCDPPPG